MLENMDCIEFLAFVPLGGSGMTLPLAQHLSILGHAIVPSRSTGSRRKPQNFTLSLIHI